MRIVFMGSSDFAVPCLRRMALDGHDIAGVFTQPDKPKNRGLRLTPPPVKEAALELGLSVFQPPTLRDGRAMEILRGLSPELIVVVAYGKILPPDMLALPPLGCVNAHGSLLPRLRGAAPIQWSVINGDEVSGVTTMYMDAGMDTGDMILSESTPIGPKETYGELHDRLAVMGAELLSETVRLIARGEAPRQKQDDALATYAPMLDKKIAALDFSKSAAALHNQVRGMSPAPVAHTLLGGELLKVHRAAVAQGMSRAPGEVLAADKRFVIGCGEGALELLEVQAQGSKRMSAADFLRGRRIPPGTVLGV